MQGYEIFKPGPEKSATFVAAGAGTPAKLELVSWSSGEPFKKASFLVQCPVDWYCLQGNGSQTLEEKFPFPYSFVMRVDVDTPDERWVYVLGVSAGGTVYVKRISDVISAFGTFINSQAPT